MMKGAILLPGVKGIITQTNKKKGADKRKEVKHNIRNMHEKHD